MQCPKDFWELGYPQSFGVFQAFLQVLLDELVYRFYLVIGLRMCWGGVEDFGALLGEEFSECVIVKLCPIISDDGLWYPKSAV